MRIGVDCRVMSRPRSGIGLSLEHILAELQRMVPDHDIFLFSNREFQFSIVSPRFTKVVDHRNRRMPGTLWLQSVLPHLIRKHRIDVFLGFEHILPISVDIPTVLNINDLTWIHYPETMTPLSYWMNRLFIPASLAKCSSLVTISRYTMKTVVDAFPKVRMKPRRVIHLAGTLSGTIPGSGEEVLGRLNIREPFILTVGSFEPRKNLPALVRAYSSMNRSGLQLVMVGVSSWKTGELDKLQKRIPEAVLAEVKMLKGISREDLKRLYMQAELFVFPSLFEGFGIPLLEAMECGTPVLSSNAASLPELGGSAVCWFDPFMEGELLDTLQRLLDSPDELRRLRREGPERARLFSWRQTAEQWLQVLTDPGAQARSRS